MSAWDEQPEQQNDIADLETARLALRGAIQSVRSLQDLNGKLKGEVQDFLHREKALNERLIRLQTELNDSYAHLDQETAHDREREAATRELIRQEIVAEQNHKWQSEIDALRQSVQNWTEVRRQKETELRMLKETLLSKEQEVFTLQKEKITAEENAHREILETIKRSREGVTASVEQAIRTKEKEIGDLKRQLAAQPKIIEERMQQIEQDLHRKEQSLLLAFRDRQQSLEMDWAHREKELWEKATEAREALEHELKSQWDERRKTLEDTFQKRQTTLEIQAQQQFEEYQRRSLSRDEELHKTWAAKEASLAQEWASREKEMARQFQAALDEERLRASEQAAQLKSETDLWRKNHAETLRRKEDDFNKAHVANEQTLRGAYRKKEEDLLARHQEALEIAQHQISELMTRASEKEGFAKTAQDRLTNAVKERDAMADRLGRLEADALRRNAELEKLIKTRDEELARIHQTSTTRDEARSGQIQNLERDQLHKESELKVLREKILQAETDRKTALEHAAALENEFTARQQQLEEAFRQETETLGVRLAASSHDAAERQQTDQRKIAELAAEAQQRAAEIQGLTHQLQLARHDIEKITQDASDKQTKSLLIRRQMEERLGEREAELAKQIETLEKERFLIEERLDARVAELEQELGRRLSEDRALQERFRQSEEFRADLEQQAGELRDRLSAHEKQAHILEDEVRSARETAEKERIAAEQKLQSRIGDLEANLVKQEGISTNLKEQLAREAAERQEELQAAQMREARLGARAQTLEQQLKTQEEELHARLSAVQEEHARIETALRQEIQAQDAAHMKTREHILGQAAALEGDLRRRELEVKTLKDQIVQEERTQLEKTREQQQREAALEDRVQFLYKSLEAQKAEHEAQVESTDHAYLKAQDALRAQVLQLETDLGRKTTEAADLLARLTQAQVLHNELRESVTQLEARAMDREQALRAAAQTHFDSEHTLEMAVTELKAAMQKRDADLLAVEKALKAANHERQAEAAAAALREKQLEERAQSLDDKLHAQKDQITMRLSGVERQRLQNEETLHTRTLDLEQRLAEKTGFVKTLQDQVSRAVSDHEHLEKKMVSVEAHLARADQQLKARETEFQSLKSATQKEMASAVEAHQRKLLELQGQRLTLEADLKGLQETLHHAEEEKKRLTELRASLEERLRADAQAHHQALDALLKERMNLEEANQKKLLSFEEAVAAKTNALQALEHRLTMTEEQRTDRDQLAALLQKEIHDLQLSLAAQQEEFRARLAGFEKERAQLQETQANRITHLESQLQYRESALRSLEEKVALTKADHDVILEAAVEREAALAEKTRTLETVLAGQTKEWQTRMEGLLSDRMKTETDLHGRVVNLQETLSVREKELAVLKDTLTQTEATQEALSASSAESIAFSAKERQALEERVLHETGRVRDLESQLRGHAVHIKEMGKSLAAAAQERAFLQTALDQLAQRVDEESTTREIAHADKTRLLQNKLEAVEREWRERLDESSQTSVLRVDALQGKVVELECALGVRENDLSALRQGMAELTLERERLVDLVSEKERERRTLSEAAAHDKEEFAARLSAVESERKTAEDVLNAQLKTLRETLEQKLSAERQRSQSLDTQLAAQISELRQLRAALVEAKDERERLLNTLAAEREKASVEFKARDQSSVVLEADLRQEMQAQHDDFKGKLAAAEKEAARQLLLLQARAAELEQALAVQRAAAEERAAILKSEKAQSLEMLESRLSQEHAAREKALQSRMLELRDALAARVAEVQTLGLGLRDSEQERAALEQYSTAGHAEATLRREELERQLADMREHEQRLETQCTAQISELNQLQSALQDLRAERETLLSTLAAERAKTAQDLKGRQKAAAEIEAALRIHFETQMAQSTARFDALQLRTLELEEKSVQKQAAIERLQAALKESEQARISLEQYALDRQTASAARQEELEKQVLAERQRAQTLETQLTVQLSELQALRSDIKDTSEERARVLQTLAEERAQTTAALKVEKNQAAALEKEFRERLSAVNGESSQRQAALQARLLELEKSAGEKQASLERLAEAIAQEESKRAQAEKQWALEVDNRRAAEALAARQKTDFDTHLAALQAERKLSEESLHARLLELRDTLSARAADIQKLEVQLKETEQARAALDYYSTASHAENAQKRDALEGELRVERAHVQELDMQLTTQQSELRVLRGALEETQSEREELLKTLAAERQNAAAALKADKNAALTSEALLRSQSEAKEKEFRERLAALDMESEKRLRALQSRTSELEKSAAAQRSELEQRIALLQAEKTKSDKQMQIQLSEWQTQFTLKQAELEAVQHQLAAVEKERSAFVADAGETKKVAAERLKLVQQRLAALEKSEAEKQASLDRLAEAIAHEEAKRAQAEKQWALEVESRRAAEALAARQKTDFDAHLAALLAERKLSEEGLHARFLELRDTLAARVADVQKLEVQLKETEQARAALDYYSTASHAEGLQKRAALEQELGDERARLQELDMQLATQQSELNQWRSALEETKAEREQLLLSLVGEREKAAEALRLQKNTGESKEKEFRERLAALDGESEKQTQALRSRVAELEKGAIAQRSDLEQRIALLQAQKTKSEKQLQTQLSELQAQLIVKQGELEAIQSQLLSMQKEQAMLEATAGENKKAAAERLKIIQQRVTALEQSEAEKQASLERLTEAIAHEESRRFQAEKQWALESENRRAAEALAARQKIDFDAHLVALQADHKLSEDALQVRLLELRDTLTARGADIQKLDVQLKETEQARAALDYYSTASHTESVQKREALEGELHAERAHVQELDTQLTGQQSELKQLRSVLEETKLEREQLLRSLADDRQKAADALKLQKNTSEASEVLLRTQSEAKEKEFRERLAALDLDAGKKALTLQARIAELEKSSVAQRSDLEQRIAVLQAQKIKSEKQLQLALSDLQAQLTVKQGEVEAIHHQWQALQEEQSAFKAAVGEDKKALAERLKTIQQRAAALEKSEAEKQASLERLTEAIAHEEAKRAQAEKQWAIETENRRAAEALAARQKTDFDAHLAALQAERKLSEDALQARLLELRDTLAARAADLQKLDVQLKETEQARAALDYYSTASHAEHMQKRDALEGELRAERARVQELDTKLAAQHSELHVLRSALTETKEEREELLQALAAERKNTVETFKLEKNAADAKEKEFRERLAALDAESEKRQLELRLRTAELEKNAAVQRSELEQRIAFLQADKTKSDKQLQIQLSEMQTQLTLKQADLEAVQNQLAAAQKEHGAFEASAGENKKAAAERLKIAQQRVAALEKSEAEKQASLDRLRETVAQLEAKCAQVEKQYAAETEERHSVEALAARQKKEFEARLGALAAERKTSEAGLHQRLLELRDVLAARAADIQKLEAQLKETEQARAAVDHYSASAHDEATQRREALEQQLAGERERAQTLETQLTTQVSELKQLQIAFENARVEREQLITALAQAREKAAAALKGEEVLTTAREAAVRLQMEAQEKEFRDRLAAADQEMARRLAVLQARTAELEKTLAAQRAEFEQRFALAQAERASAEKILHAKISDIQAQWVARSAELNAVEQQLATVQKERDALAGASGDQKKAYTQQLEALRLRARELEREASEKQAGMERLREAMQELEAHRAHAQDQWEKETQERRAAQEASIKAQQDFTERLATIEAGHRSAEEALHERLIRVRTELDQRLNAENDKNQNLSTQLVAQMSELKQLRVSLEETRHEREQLLTALAAEREKTALELKERETLTTEQKRKYEQRLAAQEKEFRERLAAVDAEAGRRFNALQVRTAELEKTLAAQHSEHERQMATQRSDYEQRLALLQAEQSKSEKTLQGTLSDLQGQLSVRAKEMEALQERLALVQTQRQQWELSLNAHETETVQERRAFEERLSEARARAAAVELELKTQTASYIELQDALSAARNDGAALSNMVEEQQKKMQTELSLRETATAAQKKQYEARLAALEKDLSDRLKTASKEAASRMAALQSRAAELEMQSADKQSLVERLEDSLKDLEAKRAHLETQWTLEAKERRAAQDAAARDKENFGAVEAELHKRLLELNNALAARTAEAQRLERELKEIGRERAALEQYSTASHTENAQRLGVLQARAAELEKALMTQRSQYEERLSAFQVAAIKTEKTLQAQMSHLQTQLAAVIAERDATLQQVSAMDKEKGALKKATEEQKTAFAQRIEALHKQTLVLEQDTAQKQAALERLQTALDQLDAKRLHWETQHALRVQEYHVLQKDMAVDKERFAKQYAELRAALDQRALDVQNLERQLQRTEDARAALEKQTVVSQADFQKEKQTLDLRWSEEKKRAQELDLLLKTNIAQIKDLKEALFAEQKQYKTSAARNDDYEQRLEEWRRRTSELERLGAEKQTALDHLRDALAQAEAKKAQAEHEREEAALRLETAQAERKVAEDQLHERLNELRLQLEQRVNEESGRARDLDLKVHAQASELEQLRKAFAEESQERERLTKTLAAERERALAELKGREKTSTETTSQLWTQMQAQEKEFRFQLAALEEESGRRIALLQGRAAELEKTLAQQRSEFEQRLHALQKERSDAEEKLHVKIINLEETLNRRIAEAQALHAEFAAVESARAIAAESSGAAHGEMVRQQKAFDERLAQEHAQARTLEQELQNYKSQARQWKEALDAGKGDDEKRHALQKQLTHFERELERRDQAANDLRAQLTSLEEERDRLSTSVKREEEEKKIAIERALALEGRLEKSRREDLLAEQKMHAHLIDLEDQLERKGASLNGLEDRLQQLQKSNEDLSKALNRDSASWTRQKQELEEKLISERSRLRDLEAEQVSQKTALRDLQEALAAAEKERQQALEALKAQKERFLSDLAQRDSGTAQRHRALELEREALDKQWQERLKAAAHETLDRMETLKRRADDLEKQLAARQSELKARHDQVATLEADRRTLTEQLDTLNRDRKEEADASAGERARLLERARALEERLKEQTRELSVELQSVEETREKTKETLEQRLAQLQEQLVKRGVELKTAQGRLRMVEESRAQIEKETGQGQSQLTRERAQLEERLSAERGRTKELSGRLNDVTAKMHEVKEALAAAEDARQAQRQELARHQENEKALQQRIHSGKSGDVSALENDLAARDAEIAHLREQAITLKTEMQTRNAAEIEKRVAERLRDQMMNVLETGALKNGDSTAMQALLEEWVFGFAHQVRNPLGIIRSVAESLLEATRRQAERDSLGAILKAVDGLNLRLREFIEFSKPVKPLLQVVDVPSAVSAAVRLIEEKSLPKNVSIETIAPASGTRIWMVPDHLRTILVQLLRNAVESMSKGGHVHVAVAFDAGRQQLDIRVKDEGDGISNAHLKEVGRPFFSTKPGAIGLGLALIKRLLRAYDGKLDIESRPGHSTTIVCRMKAKQEEAGQWAA